MCNSLKLLSADRLVGLTLSVRRYLEKIEGFQYFKVISPLKNINSKIANSDGGSLNVMSEFSKQRSLRSKWWNHMKRDEIK